MLFLDLSIFRKAFRFIGAVICDVIYTLVSKVYELFMTVARLNILSSDQIQPIYQRITMILTIVMVFYVTFEFVKYTISPDTISDKEKGAGNILKRVIIVVILIALTPEIFTTAYKLQNRIIETQMISKIILGTSNGNYTTYGNDFSANMLNLFYYYDEDVCSDGSGDCADAKVAVVENINHLRATGDAAIADGINLASTHNIFKEKSPAIKFNGILAIVVGGVILYMLIMYSIDVGTRYAQLIFLQIMSPIAIMGYILPKKDGIFQKWGKQCITTYIDLFLRIAIINFVLLITKVLGDSFQNGHIFEGMGNVSDGLKVFVYIVLVIGLLAFAQRAPKLLGELFPSSGAAGLGFGLGAKSRLEPTTKAFKGLGSVVGAGRRVAGGVGGFVAGGITGRGIGGRVRAAIAGAKAGSDKNRKGLIDGSVFRRVQQASFAGGKKRQEEEDIVANAPVGTSRRRALTQSLYRPDHWANVAKEQDRQLKHFDMPKTTLDTLTAQIDEMKEIKILKMAIKAAENRGAPAEEIRTLDGRYKAALQMVRTQVVQNGGDLTSILADQQRGVFRQFTYDELDANGFARVDANGNRITHTMDFRFDTGDQNFTSPTYTIAHSEYEKAMASPVLRDIEVEINGTRQRIGDMDEQTYIGYIHKVKDAMAAPKTDFEHSTEFEEAHAFAKGSSGEGKK